MSAQRTLICVAIANALLFSPHAAWAQSVAASKETQDEQAPSKQPATLDQVVVTATRRESTLQKVPASVTAIKGQTLAEKGQVAYRDYLNTIPGVSYVSNGSYKDKIFMRGVSEGLSARTTATTGVYLDDLAISEVDASLADINVFDIDRVEVLRGPQGTLFGAGAMGGVVRIITNKPLIGSTEFIGSLDASSTQGGGDGYNINVAGNLPINDMFALRLVAGTRKTAGFIDNVVDGPLNGKDVNDAHHQSFRGQLLFQPNERVNALLSYQYSKSDYDYNTVQDIGLKDAFARRYAEFNNFKTNIVGLTVNADFDDFDFITVTNFIDKKSETGRDVTNVYGAYFPGITGRALTSDEGLGLLYQFPNKAFTQEFRLQSHDDQPLTWLVGSYFSKFSPHNLQHFDNSQIADLAGTNLYTASTDVDRKTIAAFAEATYKITPKLSATFGARITRVKSNWTETDSGYLNGDASTVDQSKYSENFDTYKYALSYNLSPNNLVYAQAASGFRPGGGNGSVSSICSASLAEIGLSSSPDRYRSDSLWSYEIGSKNTFFSNRLSVNAAAYYIDWNDIQMAKNLSCGSQLIFNVGKAKSKGGELEISARPIRNLDIDASVGYVNATVEADNTTVGAATGDPMPNVAKWSTSLSARYAYDIGAWQMYWRASYSYTSKRYSDFKRSANAKLDPGYDLTNVRYGLTDGRYDVSLYVNNLFDSHAVVNSVLNSAGLNYANIVTPRQIGVTFQFRY